MFRFTCILSAILLSGCRPLSSSVNAPEEPTAAAAPDGLGALVYRGTVFPVGSGSQMRPRFHYERRIRVDGNDLVSTHATFDSEGTLQVMHRAYHTPEFDLQSFELVQAQTATTGSLRVLADGRVEYTVHRRGRTRKRIETPDGPVIVGPTLYGHVVRHWDTLVGGTHLPIRFAVVERARSYTFVLQLEAKNSEFTTFSMIAANPILRTSMAPMRLVFDTGTRMIVRYEGRVPPMVETRVGWRPLDARVEYATKGRM